MMGANVFGLGWYSSREVEIKTRQPGSLAFVVECLIRSADGYRCAGIYLVSRHEGDSRW